MENDEKNKITESAEIKTGDDAIEMPFLKQLGKDDAAEIEGSDNLKKTDTDTDSKESKAMSEDKAICADDLSGYTSDVKVQQEEIAENQENIIKKLSDNDVTNVTAGLWNYLPIPKNEPDPYPEYLTKFKKYARSTIIGARVRGKKHKHEGTNCDDWFETASSGKITFIAVADGAGSKKYSRIGAKTACQAAVGYLKNTFDNVVTNNPAVLESLSLQLTDEKCIESCNVMAGIIQESMVKAYNAVESELYRMSICPEYSVQAGRDVNIRDLSSTLLTVVIIPIEDEKLVISCQIGDGMIAVINTQETFEKSVRLMGEPDSGDFSGETDFLVNKKMIEPDSLAVRTKLSRSRSDLIMLMSDGVADDYFPNEEQMHRLYLDLAANGILDTEIIVSSGELSARQIDMIRNIPAASEYPWVNDNSVMVGLNYTKNISDALNMSLEELWQDKSIAFVAAAQVKEKMSVDDPSERLKIWLDNYIERGSFDDRTLVIAMI